MKLDPLEEKALSSVLKHTEPGRGILVALSGGADSSALLFALHATQKRHTRPLYALHVNHLLRGAEADRDEEAAKELCSALGIPFFPVSVDVSAFASSMGIGLELAGRDIRARELIDRARSLSASVATAHTASDNAETLLFNLSRGAGLDGLCGIPPAIIKEDILFFRPLLELRREEILRYCEEHAIPFVTDSSNLSDDYTRNRIRHHVVPALNQAMGIEIENSVFRLTQTLREDAEALSVLAAQAYVSALSKQDSHRIALDAAALKALPPAISARVVRKAAAFFSVSLSKAMCDGVLSILSTASACASAPCPLVIYRDGSNLIFTDKPPERPPAFCLPLSLGETVLPDGSRIQLIKNEQFNRLLMKDAFDCDRIIGHLSVRSRLEGDTIRLSDGGGRKTLKKLMIEKKVPMRRRTAVPVVCDESGAVVAVCGFGVDIAFRPDSNSENVIIIEFEEYTI